MTQTHEQATARSDSLATLLLQSFGFDHMVRDDHGEWVMETRKPDGSTFSLDLRAALRSSPLASGWATAGHD